jgi:hypothetical protein
VVTTGDTIVELPTRLYNILISVTVCLVTLLVLSLFFLQGLSAQNNTDFVWHCSVLSPQFHIAFAVFCVTRMTHTVELHLLGLILTASHPDMQKIRVLEIFFENSNIKWKKCPRSAVLSYVFIYVQIKH